MITLYHRPQSIEEALQLIGRPSPVTLPLGGGTILSQQKGDAVEVVDLQGLGLNRITKRGSNLSIGATVTLQSILDFPDLPRALSAALRLEAPLNLRNTASVAGTLMVCDGRSGLAMVLLALDASVTILRPLSQKVSIGDFLPVRDQYLRGCLITAIEVPLVARVEFDYVARTPADRPIVAVALAQWPSGRTRLAVGGCGQSPLLAMDGPEADGLESAARNAMDGTSDPWASAEYRMDVAAVLARRCLSRLTA